MTRQLDPDPQLRIFTLRRSIFIWFCGGVIGWAAAILLVYNVFQTSDRQMAQQTQPPATVANSQNDTAADPNALEKIAPAAGPAPSTSNGH